MDAHLYDTAKHDVLAVEVRRGHSGDEELAAVGVGAGIGHAQHSGVSVFELKIFVGELLSVDRFATGAVVVGKVTPLTHELGNYTVEGGALVSESLLTF